MVGGGEGTSMGRARGYGGNGRRREREGGEFNSIFAEDLVIVYGDFDGRLIFG